MTVTAERAVAAEYRHRCGLRAEAKRQAIDALDRLERRLQHFAPQLAALYLTDMWEARRQLDWGCTPVVR